MPNEAEYAGLKEFLSIYAHRYLNVNGLPPEKRPLANLETLEKQSMKAASSGLQQAINDCVEMSLHLPYEEVSKLDLELRSRGIVTLSELRRRYSKKYAAIVRRGRIKDKTEYYLVRNVLSDPSPKAKDVHEALESLIEDYENSLRQS